MCYTRQYIRYAFTIHKMKILSPYKKVFLSWKMEIILKFPAELRMSFIQDCDLFISKSQAQTILFVPYIVAIGLILLLLLL